MTYRELLGCVRPVGGYITDPIGKCLRTFARRKPDRIDLDFLGSETFKAFQRMEDLSPRFDPSRAEKAHLIWIKVPETLEQSTPLPVLVDRASGVIEETRPTGLKRYGFLADVQACVHYAPNDINQEA